MEGGEIVSGGLKGAETINMSQKNRARTQECVRSSEIRAPGEQILKLKVSEWALTSEVGPNFAFYSSAVSKHIKRGKSCGHTHIQSVSKTV